MRFLRFTKIRSVLYVFYKYFPKIVRRTMKYRRFSIIREITINIKTLPYMDIVINYLSLSGFLRIGCFAHAHAHTHTHIHSHTHTSTYTCIYTNARIHSHTHTYKLTNSLQILINDLYLRYFRIDFENIIIIHFILKSKLYSYRF